MLKVKTEQEESLIIPLYLPEASHCIRHQDAKMKRVHSILKEDSWAGGWNGVRTGV